MTRHGSVLMAVLVVVAMGAALGTSALLSVQSHRAGTDAEVRRAQSRALAWSGVQAAMREVAAQRDALLAGGRPDLTGSWTLFEDDLGRQGVVRLIDLDGEGEGLAAAESAKLDVNRATEEMLARLPGVGEALAKRIVEERARGAFSSAEELLRVPGVTPELLYGAAPAELAEELPGAAPVEPAAPEAESRGLGQSRARRSDARGAAHELTAPLDLAPAALIDLVTVYSFDPNVIAGLGELEGHRGELRVNLNQPWSEDLGRVIARIWNDDVAQGVQRVMNSGVTFKADSDIVKEMRKFGVTTDFWGMVLDAFCTSDDQYRVGRVDVMNARPEVLACLPGLDMDAARRIVERREQITREQALTPAWIVDAPPGSEGAVTQEQYEQAADWVSVRSLQWRVRIEVGFTLADSALDAEGEAGAAGEAELIDRAIWEAVIDASAERPRLAYLRDVSMLEAARTIGRTRAALDARLGVTPPVEKDEAEPADTPTPPDRGDAGASGDFPEAGAGDEGEEGDSEIDREGLRGSRRGGRGFEEPSRLDRPPPGRGPDRTAGDEAPDGGEVDDAALESGESARGETPEAVDRRIGRWTAKGRTP